MSHVYGSITHLLERFTTSQLRELDLSLARNTDSLTKPTNHKSFIQAIIRRYEGKKLVAHALRLEAVLPYKHVFLFTFSVSGGNASVERLKDRIEKGFPSLFDNPEILEPGEDLAPEVCVFDKERKRLLIKFVHLVETWVWEWNSSRTKEMKMHKRRHPVVVSILPGDRLMTVSFPGFTQGTFPPDIERTTYQDIARNACAALSERTDIHAGEFPLRQTIDLILQREPDVKAVRRYVKAEDGRLMLDSREGPGSSEEFLSERFRREAHIDVSEDAIRTILRSMDAVDILLHWKKKEIYTRISFHDYAPEILFIWKSMSPDAALIDEVLAVIVEYQNYVGGGKLSEALNFVDRTKPGTIIRPAQVVQQFSLSLDDTLKILYRAMERGVVDIRFRVKTDDALLDFNNEWRNNLTEFPREVTDEHGHHINLGEHKNIEVAFQRLSA
jgi:hypothetical protein